MNNLRNPRNPEAEIPRNRPGSLFIELDLQVESTSQKIGAYYIDLVARDERWKASQHYVTPEMIPGQTEIELGLLRNLILQDGKLNFWDYCDDLKGSNEGTLSIHFAEACDRLVTSLDVEPQEQA